MAYSRSEVKIEGSQELIRDLKRMGVSVRKTLGGAMKAGGQVISTDADSRLRIKQPVNRGKRVSAKVTARKPDHITVSIGPTPKHWYLRFKETGAAAHEINAHNGGKLVFTNREGQKVEVRSVQHPGMAAEPFLRPAIDTRGDAAVKVVGEALRQAVEDAKIAAEGADDH